MGKRAFIFPGQGSQYVGMGRDLLANFKVVKEIFEEASDAIGLDIARLAVEGPEEDLNLTVNTQPAILTTSVAALEVLSNETGMEADFLAGHSLGEYTALVQSGVIGFCDAVRIVRRRGELMQEAVPDGEGAMAAILGMDRDEVESLCADAADGCVVSPANFNCPGQIVIAGHRRGVEKAVELAGERGARKALLLPVSVPSHCVLMESAAVKLKEELGKIEMCGLAIPVISNVDALPYPSSEEVTNILARQLSSPVRWEESILYLRDHGVETVIEVGPGRVLSGLVKRIDRGIKTLNIEDVQSLKKILAAKL